MSIDRSPQAPNATSPVAPMSPSAQRAASPSDDGRSSNASRAPSSQDPYYSNEDIAALHSVVVAAQELLDTAPEPKPLPAAALFKAYDQVLPTYGIDPDTDHHLSTFVFRVGGERGGGTLLDKFQSILGRMGIVLEFGDNTTASSRTSPSASPAYSSTSRQSHGLVREKNGNSTSEGVAVSRPSVVPLVQSSASPESQPQQNHVDFSDTDEEDGEYEEMRRAVLSSAMNRWRSLVANRRTQQAQRIPSFPSIPEEASADVRNFEDRPFQDRPAITVSEASTIPRINGVKPDGQVSDKGTTDVNVHPISPLSPVKPRPAIIDAIRPSTASTQQSQNDAVVAHHEDDAPSSPQRTSHYAPTGS
ncbi:regulator of (H+)-ATPase in vacuolar membrane [Fusarium falciforme]|nr:regulator of (H+)-ATPase in vacuolar membrane [Fusarium falciforme]